nr:maleylacetate reductase [Streptomyces sp. DSM 15324]
MRERALDFTCQAQPMRVLFRSGAVPDAVPDAVALLALCRVLVLCDDHGLDTARAVAASLGDACADLHAGAVTHVPVEVADLAVEAAREARADGCVAVGGGSVTGLAKAVALRTGLPIVAVPTTYAGSGMTPVWGLTEGAVKRTGRDPKVVPRSVVYDPLLTLTMPPVGCDQRHERDRARSPALYAPDCTPIVSLMPEEGVRAPAAALPEIVADPSGHDARSRALYGAWLCGACLGATSTGLHHKLCHVLGGTFDLPHAETHAVVLPHVPVCNAPAVPEAPAALRRALDVPDPVRELHEPGEQLGIPRSLADLGPTAAGVDRAVDVALGAPYANPRPASADDLRAVLHAAWAGEPPYGG